MVERVQVGDRERARDGTRGGVAVRIWGLLFGEGRFWNSIRFSAACVSRLRVYNFTEMCCGTEAGSYLRLIDSCITQLKAQGPSRTCNESKEEEEGSPGTPDDVIKEDSHVSLLHYSRA